MQPDAQAALRRAWLNKERARYTERVQQQPDDLNAWRHIGRTSWEMGDIPQAVAAFNRIVAAQPRDADALLGQIGCALRLNQPGQALAVTTQLLTMYPLHADGLLYQLEALARLGRRTEAIACADRVLTLPHLDANRRAMAFSGKVQALENMERFAEAVDTLDTITEPVSLEMVCTKARILATLQRFDEADAILEKLQEHIPHRDLEQVFEPWRLPTETFSDSLLKRYTGRGLYLMRFFYQQAICDWRQWDTVLAQIEDLSQDAMRYSFVAGMEAFSLLNLPIAPALQTAVATAQATAVAAHMAPIREKLSITWPTTLHEGRLRIGYVSGDFRHHATAHLARKLFATHDRSQYEVFGFSLRPGDNSRYWQDIVQGCDRFIELGEMNHSEAALRIAQEGIHILVDMHGYTRFARPEIFALQPAPIQVDFLGYPGTLGADFIPYIVADPVVLPEELRPFFSEQPLYVDCYQVNDDEQPIAETGLTREAAGLPKKGFVYCCFNRPNKIDPTTFASWMRILQRVPNSVLWLLESTPHGAYHLQQSAKRAGVASERLIFAPRLPKDQHLERHRLADVFLDTFVYNAHTTASDALWAGLPIVTLCGPTFPARVCTSLLSALGLADWLVTSTISDYEERAVALSQNPEMLHTIRSTVHQRRLGTPFDTAHFARQLEQAFVALWAAYQQAE